MASPKLLVLVFGLLPAVVVVTWECRRRASVARLGFLPPVSSEAVRWGQYTGAAYQLGYAAIALCYIDGLTAQVPLLWVVLCTCLTVGLLLWHVGANYGAETPRLTDLREQCYHAQVALRERTRRLVRETDRWPAGQVDADIQLGDDLIRRADRQLLRLQLALTSEAFTRRVMFPDEARSELRALDREQRQLLQSVGDYLGRTAPLIPAAELERQAVIA